jgi:hypothetical protein
MWVSAEFAATTQTTVSNRVSNFDSAMSATLKRMN